MNFVFINPPREIAANNIWRIINSENPPLGIALLSAIWDEKGHSSQIIDAAALQLKIPEIITMINPATDFVGITATTPEISHALVIARKVREIFPNIKIIMGGAHPTVFHKELVGDKLCDMVVRNEGEIPIVELAKGTPCNLIPNLTWRKSDNEVVVNPDAETYVDLNTLPLPAYHKLPMHLYHSALGAARQAPSIGMITTRGCPGKCTFCFSGMFGSQIRFTSAVRIVEHIEHLQNNYGIREISFYDDTFTANKKNVAELCQLILLKNIKLSWSCFSRVDSVTPELLLLMKKAGCHQIMYGFETVDTNILKNINKGTNLEQSKKAIDWTQAAKINVRGAFMLGNPGETITSMGKTINYATTMAIPFAVFNITTPYPGTAMYKEFSTKNLLMHQNWDLYNLAEPILTLDTVSGDAVKQYYYKAYRDFYLRPGFILKHIFSRHTLAELLIYVKAVSKVTGLLFRNAFSKQSLQGAMLVSNNLVKKNKYSFFCPAYYDENNIAKVVEKAVSLFSEIAQDYEICIINDGSPDETGKVCEELSKKYEKVKVIHHKTNLGYGVALKDGFLHANKFEYVCFTDGDNQYDVYDFKKMIPLLPEYDMIIGSRKQNANSNIRKVISFCYNFSVRLLFGTKFRDMGAALRIVKRSAVNNISILCDGSFAPAEIIIKLHKLDYKIGIVPISSYPRIYGKSTSLSPKNFAKTILEMLKVLINVRLKRY